MAVDRGGRSDSRQRRALQRIAADAIGALSLIEGAGISLADDTIAVSLNPTDPGLTLTGGLALLVASGEPFGLTGGLSLSLATAGGLEVDTSELGIKLDTNPGLALSASGLIVDLHSNSGLELTSTGIRLDTANDGGIQLQSNELGIKLQSSSGLDLTASGLAIDPGSELEINGSNELNAKYPDGRHLTVSNLDAIATLYEPDPGDFVILDPTAGNNQSIKLPDPSTCAGERITIKNIDNIPTNLLIIAQREDDYVGRIEGIPPNSVGTSYITVAAPNAGMVITSDGSDWWITSNYNTFTPVAWRAYPILWTDWDITGTYTAEIEIINASVDQRQNAVIMGAFTHQAQGWFTKNSGQLDMSIEVTDSSTGGARDIIPSTTLYPAATVTAFTGRSAMVTPDLVATGTVTVTAKFTVSMGTADINDTTQGKITLFLLWGVIGPDRRDG